MLRSARIVLPRTNILLPSNRCQRLYANSKTEKPESGSGKVLVGIFATAGLGCAGAIVYGKYDPNFRILLENNIPYIKTVYKYLPDWDSVIPAHPKESSGSNEKFKEHPIPGILKKKESQAKELIPEEKMTTAKIGLKSSSVTSKEHKTVDENHIMRPGGGENIYIDEDKTKREINSADHVVNERLLKDLIQKLEKHSKEAFLAHKSAVDAIQHHTKKLYEALDMPDGKDDDLVWREANEAAKNKNAALNLAVQKAAETEANLKNLQAEIRKAVEKDSGHPILKYSEDTVKKIQLELQKAEEEVAAAQIESKTATEYKELINTSKEQFRKELQIVLPKYLHTDKDETVTEDELNLLIAHAHRRIEQLQKQIAKQQLNEKYKMDQAIRLQKLEDEKLVDSIIETELEKRRMDLESAVQNRVASLKDELEMELRQQLRRQAAAHADHLQEVLKVQQQELERAHTLKLEEKLLHQKGIFISEVSGSMAHLKGIAAYLKAKSEFDRSSKKAQALWLACQAMDHKLSIGKFNDPCPLAKELAAIKIAAGDESEFVNSVIAGIPSEAVNRGVFTNDTLKQRFHKVKQICRKVALVNDNNNSLYMYFISYFQSLLVIDATSVPKAELEGKVAVNPSEWDTFDILTRVSYCLQIDDMEQALRYANQLKGQPKIVAKDWIEEVRLLLETKLAVKALLTHAAAVGVQAYH